MIKHFGWLTLIIAGLAGSAPGNSVNANHLVISEIFIDAAVETNNTSAEFVEIYNPTDQPVDLGNYYLTDYANYYLLPAGTLDFTAPGDYMVRFPAETMLLPGSVAVVTQSATQFFTETGASYGGTAAGFASQAGSPLLFEIADTDPAVPQVINLRQGAPDPVTFHMQNDGEFVVLMYWDGMSDLVSDVDIVGWGVPTGANHIPNKGGIAIDGPDADTEPTTYRSDGLFTGIYLRPAPDVVVRTTIREFGEGIAIGNGITGHDETVENLTVSFIKVQPHEVSPGIPHNSLVTSSVSDWSVY